MQKKAVIIIVIAVLGLAGLSIVQSRRAADLKAQAELAQQQADEARQHAEADAQALEDQRSAIERLKNQKSVLSRKLQEAVDRPAPSSPAPLEGEPKAASSKGGFFAKMLSDPAMKKMMRAQQEMMIGQMYGPLFETLNLLPEEQEKMVNLMLEQQLNAAQKGMAMMDPDTDRAALKQTLAEDKKQFDAEMKALLGDDRFAQLEEYNQSLPDRMALNQMKTQFGDAPLSEQQSAQLFAAMKDERSRATAEGRGDPQQDMEMMLSEEAMNKFFAEQEAINVRIIERATADLTPKQIQVLTRSLAQNLAMQRTGMAMARSMFGGEDGAGDPSAPAAK